MLSARALIVIIIVFNALFSLSGVLFAQELARFDFETAANGIVVASGYTVSVLEGAAPGVRTESLSGNYVFEIVADRLASRPSGDIPPGETADCISFPFDLGLSESGPDNISLCGQGWFSLDGGVSWTPMRSVAYLSGKGGSAECTTVRDSLLRIALLSRKSIER